MTYVGEYYEREKKHYMACHYSLLVHSFKNSKCVYCDSLGRSKPIFLDSYIQELILLLKNEVALIDIVECHYNNTKFRSCQVKKHKYTQEQSAWYFPMQVCGNICGASVVVFQGVRQSVESAALNIFKKIILRNISKGSAHEVVYRKQHLYFYIIGEKLSYQATQRYATRPQRKEERIRIALHCPAKDFCFHQAINNQRKKSNQNPLILNPTVVSTPFTQVNSIFYFH